MKEDGEREEGLPSGGEEAEQEPQPEPLYDPLTEPWNDPASTSVVQHRLSEGRQEFAPRPGAAPDYREPPYPGVEELSELRRRLREETVVVPRPDNREKALHLMFSGLMVLLSGWLVSTIAHVEEPMSPIFLIWLGSIAIGCLGALYGIASLVLNAPIPYPRQLCVALREAAETLLLAALIFVAVAVSMQNFKVEGASMEPSLDNDEYLIVNKLAYAEIDLSIFDWVPFFDAGDDPVHHLWASPARGDVIVFRSPTAVPQERDFIKRIIGEPGDVVEVDRETGAVEVNGEVLDEPYIHGQTTCPSSCGPWTVPERSYFVMGDNRSNSSDSRQGWFVPEENIIGKALITYWHDDSPELDLAPNHEVSFISEAAAEE